MKTFEDLRVWQDSVKFANHIYEITKKFPTNEKFELIQQLRSAAVSIPSNIAEGKGRLGKKAFCQFLSIARGSAQEIHTQLLICKQQNYISEIEYQETNDQLISVCKMINALIKSIREN